jgi:DNA modification methylase
MLDETYKSYVYNLDCIELLKLCTDLKINTTFFDPPFNQNRSYDYHNDNMPDKEYWEWISNILHDVYKKTVDGGCIFFMQREKNAENVLRVLRETGWLFHNLIVWRKLTRPTPNKTRLGKMYQIIAYAIKGEERLYTFNQLRIDSVYKKKYKSYYDEDKGTLLVDIWDDVLEMTSGFLAGGEVVKKDSEGNIIENTTGYKGKKEPFHKQQAPIHLLLRILLLTTKVNDIIFDPFSGTGTSLITAQQLKRYSIGSEIDPKNVDCINWRLSRLRKEDDVMRYYEKYIYTEGLTEIWGCDTLY